jgi:hypothetical protein
LVDSLPYVNIPIVPARPFVFTRLVSIPLWKISSPAVGYTVYPIVYSVLFHLSNELLINLADIHELDMVDRRAFLSENSVDFLQTLALGLDPEYGLSISALLYRYFLSLSLSWKHVKHLL